MIQFFGAVFALILLLAIKQNRDAKLEAEKQRDFFKNFFGNYEKRKLKDSDIAALMAYHRATGESCAPGVFEIDEITWKDLNLDELFSRMDCCLTYFGEEKLYDMLRNLQLSESILKKRDALASYFYENEKERVDFQLALERIGRNHRSSIRDYIKNFKEYNQDKKRNTRLVLDISCLVLGIVSGVMIFALPTAGFFLFLFTLFFNLIIYYRIKRIYKPLLDNYAGVLKLIYSAKMLQVLKTQGEAADMQGRLNQNYEVCRHLIKGSVLMLKVHSITGGLLDLVLDYFRMFLHIDLISFYFMAGKVEKLGRELIEMADIIGEYDAAIAIASFRKSLKVWCRPEFSDNGFEYRADELINPLIDEPIGNDVCFDNCVIVTGSNASGKSTFLRSAALGAVLAQTIYTVPAKKYQFSFVKVATSMNLSDNIVLGDSYYMAEIKSLKRILDECKKEGRMFCVIDEVLKGTNTAERIASSREILKFIAQSTKRNTICLAATHDLELVNLLDEIYDAYHFSEEVDEERDEISFSYKIKEGRSKSRNAIRLLKLMGYDEIITEAAMATCEKYLEKGIYV